MHQPSPEQFAHQEAHAARSVEMVHVGWSVRIDACQQWRHGTDIGEVFQHDLNACGRSHGRDMKRVVGGTAGRH